MPMPSLVKKIVYGRTYYYLRESQRVKGKPKIVWTKYIGTIEKIQKLVEYADKPFPPDETRVYSFGSVALCYSIIENLGIQSIIDEMLPKRQQGFLFSTYILISAINRTIESKSKNKMRDWLKRTSLPRIMGLSNLKAITSQHFWNHSSHVREDHIDEIVNRIRQTCVQLFHLPMDVLLYDTTNYFTYISTFNSRNKVARRGHNKQKRDDLRQIGWVLMVSELYHIPIFQKVYAGNINDFSQFRAIIPDLKKITGGSDSLSKVTFIFDAGNWCKYNAEVLKDEKIDFITTLKPSDHKDLLEIQRNEENFKALNEKGGVWVHRIKKKIYLRELTVLVVFSQTYFEKELKTYLSQKNRAKKKLKDLKIRLEKTALLKNNPPRKKESIQNELDKILSPVYLRDCFRTDISDVGSYPQLQFKYKEKAFQAFIERFCGKELIATTRDDLSSEKIVEAKYHQSYLENAFKITKDRSLGGWWPIYHWTDQQIMVHGFCCYLALLILSIIKMRLKECKIEIGLQSLFNDYLKYIYELEHIYKNKNNKVVSCTSISKLDTIQSRIVKNFYLKKYIQNNLGLNKNEIRF